MLMLFDIETLCANTTTEKRISNPSYVFFYLSTRCMERVLVGIPRNSAERVVKVRLRLQLLPGHSRPGQNVTLTHNGTIRFCPIRICSILGESLHYFAEFSSYSGFYFRRVKASPSKLEWCASRTMGLLDIGIGSQQIKFRRKLSP